MRTPLPVSLYAHYPWCVRKCPYCDFNSYGQGSDAARDARYFSVLAEDFRLSLSYLNGRKLVSVYFGGGTPSLASPEALGKFIELIGPSLGEGCEISMEANPGTVDEDRLRDFRGAGVNRLSLGIQSFNDRCLKALGRIHSASEARDAVEAALKAGFENVNLDLMHGLPHQSPGDALSDLKIACSYPVTHLSWYELTLEEGTVFGRHPPRALPDEDSLAEIEERGFEYLADSGFARYEISAFARNGRCCVHNRNYWMFHDYLGLGAGGCGKIFADGVTLRRACPEDPVEYLKGNFGEWTRVPPEDLPFEFALNRLRIFGAIGKDEFTETTGLEFARLEDKLARARDMGLLTLAADAYELTARGRLMLNDILELFL